jgi:hypothetical protein
MKAVKDFYDEIINHYGKNSKKTLKDGKTTHAHG